MRLTSEQLKEVMKKYGVDKIYSWSKVSCFMTSPYEYYLKYVLHKKGDVDNCAYAPMGSISHDIIERFYNGEIEYGNMLENFDDGWLTAIEIADLKFDRNDETKNANIKNKYKENLEHFFKNHSPIVVGNKNDFLKLEQFMVADINGHLLQGYIDAIHKEGDDYTIIDWKTSTKYSGKTAEDKCGQLVIYAIGLHQKGVPYENIKIAWNFLKYVTIEYQQKNGAIKTRDVERCKIGESLQANAKTWLKACGYEDEMDDILKVLLDSNDINTLPSDVREKYKIEDCYVYVPLTEALINNWFSQTNNAIVDIEMREADYAQSQNENIFWDSDESVQKESYYFATLCEYSANLHKPYKKYLERIDKAKNGEDTFSGLSDNTSESTPIPKVVKNNDDDIDLSWLDNL